VQWSRGGGWLYASISLDEADLGGLEPASARAYEDLAAFVSVQRESHVARVWNYLAAINQGDGDDERYKQFCSGRARGMGEAFGAGFPAATAIGHHGAVPRLQVYLLASEQPGTRVENPRQVSAWRYPRQYGPTPPSFARAMRLPADDALAISGTAAVIGHASAHHDDLNAQLEETLANLEALLASADMAAGFDTHSPLKAYVRHPADARQVRDFFRQRLPAVPPLLLHGDICRRELLVEIDGWRYA
jgi:chorismate lyase/3-hydroxybenzoate synthase